MATAIACFSLATSDNAISVLLYMPPSNHQNIKCCLLAKETSSGIKHMF